MMPLPPMAGVMHVQPAGGVIETNVALAGTEVVKTGNDAALGPLFVSVCV
jgi:hypothetical protein